MGAKNNIRGYIDLLAGYYLLMTRRNTRMEPMQKASRQLCDTKTP